MSKKDKMPRYYREHHYTSDDGQTVIEREYFNQEPGEPVFKLFGVASIILNMQLPNGQVAQREHVYDFPIKASEVGEAFMRFESTKREAQEKELKRLQSEVDDLKRKQANQLVVPSNPNDIKGLRAS